MRRIPPTITAAVVALATSCAHQPQSPVCLAGAYLGDDGYCHAQRAPVHHLPFRDGYKTRVRQGYHGAATHKGDRALSIDFTCDEGDPVVATRSGKVLEIKEDSRRGCADPSCASDANFITLDHGDGTFGEYAHLRQYGALVEPGEDVCMGQVIGVCGNTGYSGGPHLHYGLTNAMNRSVPVQFVEGIHQGGLGFLAPQTDYTSENTRVTQCKAVNYSRLGRDAFIHQGIILDEEVPIVVEPDAREWVLSGTYRGGYPRISVHRRAVSGGPWVDECVRVQKDGSFTIPIRWDDTKRPPGPYFFMMTGSDDTCAGDGWPWSYRIHLR